MAEGFDAGAFAAGAKLGNGIAGFMQGGQNPQTGQPTTIMDRFRNANIASNNGGVDSLVQDANKAKALRGVLTAYADAMPNEDAGAALKAKAHTMGLGDLEGFVQGQVSQQTARTAQAQQQEAQARAAYLTSGEKEKEDEAGGLARWAQTMDQQLNPAPGQPAGDDSLLKQFSAGSRASFHAIAAMGAANPRLAAPLLKPLFEEFSGGAGKSGAEDTGDQPSYTEDPVTGARALLYGKSVVPTGQRPSSDATQAQPVMADGELSGYNVPTGKGKFSFQPLKTMTDDQKGAMIVKHGNAVTQLLTLLGKTPPNQTNVISAINDQLGQHQAAIKALGGKGDEDGGSKVAKARMAGVQPTPADIEYLRTNPNLAAKFEARFGKGAADQYLP